MQVELYLLGAMLRPGGFLLVEVGLGQGLSLSRCSRRVETYPHCWCAERMRQSCCGKKGAHDALGDVSFGELFGRSSEKRN